MTILEASKYTYVRSRQVVWTSQAILLIALLANVISESRLNIILILSVACIVNAIALIYVERKKHETGATIFSWNLTINITLLLWMNNGLLDTALLVYPGILIYTAILGSRKLYLTTCVFIFMNIALLGLFNLNGWYVNERPTLKWPDIIDISLILLAIGFSIRLFASDLKNLVARLDKEINRVQKSKDKIQQMIQRDPLTNLPNRALAQDRFSQSQARSRRDNSILGVLFIDLDRFKPVNDTLGHDVGDILLIEVAARVSELVRKKDSLCRVGGDEFILILEGCPNQIVIAEIAQKILSRLNKPYEINSHKINISCSIGVAVSPQDSETFSELCQQADMAMYQAKKTGRGNVTFYNEDFNRQMLNNLHMLNDLRQAIKDKMLHVYYQPKIDLDSGEIIGAEALIRWEQKDGTFIPPDVFIPIAEKNGLINEIGIEVLFTACAQCKKWHEQYSTTLTVAVNLSVFQFNDARLVKNVFDALSKNDLPAHSLELEITESVFNDANTHISDQIDLLRDMGVKFSIDDFGTGYSNLGYLKNHKMDYLKIDRTFIKDIVSQEQDLAIVKAIIQMSTSLGLQTIAEGVEDFETPECIKSLGCNYGQGYFWSKPLPPIEFLEFIESYEKLRA